MALSFKNKENMPIKHINGPMGVRGWNSNISLSSNAGMGADNEDFDGFKMACIVNFGLDTKMEEEDFLYERSRYRLQICATLEEIKDFFHTV